MDFNEIGEFANVQCSIVICHFAEGKEAFHK